MNVLHGTVTRHTSITTTYHAAPAYLTGARPTHPSSDRCCNGSAGGSLQLSSKAMMLMALVALMSSLAGGDYGELMDWLSAGEAELPGGNPGFGETRRTTGGPPAGTGPAVADRVAPGQVRELKAGETVRGANGTHLRRGENGKVEISYQDRNGQTKSAVVKDGMISFDGGEPRKLANVGHMLELPNGDVVALGHNPRPDGGKDLVRVAMADAVENVKCEPAHATNIYQVEELEQERPAYEGREISLNYTSASCLPFFGGHGYHQAAMRVLLGNSAPHAVTEQLMRLVGTK